MNTETHRTNDKRRTDIRRINTMADYAEKLIMAFDNRGNDKMLKWAELVLAAIDNCPGLDEV